MSASVKSTAQRLVQKTLSGMIIGGTPATTGVGIATKIFGKISKETLGYDFVGLIVKIFFFYVFALIADGVISAIITGNGFVATVTKLLGKSIPNFLPDSIVQFYTDGYNGVKYWDLVNFGIMALIGYEALQYIE